MKSRSSPWSQASVCVATVLVIVLLLLAAAPAEAGKPAPKSRYYFMVAVGFYADYDVSAECFKFTNNKMKSVMGEGIVGEWKFTEKGSQEAEIHVEVTATMEMDGMPLEIMVDGYGRIDSRGPKSAFGGAAQANIPAFTATSNFAMAGREVKKKKQCIKMANDFNELMGIE